MVSGNPISNRFQIYLLKDFSLLKSSTCSANLNSRVFGKLILENTVWPNYFCKKLFLWPIHMAWSLGKSFGSRRRSIRVGGFIWFLEHFQTQRDNQLKIKSQIMQKFLSNHILSWFIILSVVPSKSGCDRPTPLTRISSPRFPN